MTATQEKIVRRWFTDNSFATELRTPRCMGLLLEEEFGVPFHSHYLAAWLRQRRYTP